MTVHIRNTLFVRIFGLAILVTICIWSLLRTYERLPEHVSQYVTAHTNGLLHSKPTSKYAYVLFQADYSNELRDDEEDVYYMGTRVVIQQLLHNPKTRTNTSIPVVVLATEDVKPHRLEQLRKDGADVRIVQKIPPAPWSGGHKALARWADAYAKLRTFELVDFEKALFMDSDMLVVDRLDSIFQDPATDILTTKTNLGVEDEGPLPAQYMVAAQRAFMWRIHSYPPAEHDSTDFSSGFYVCHPSKEAFAYYLSLLQVPNRVAVDTQDQDLMHYAHRRDGPMPWTDLQYQWTTTWPSLKDYQLGAKTLHEKFWEPIEGGPEYMDPELKQLWEDAKSEMMERTRLQHSHQ